MLQHTFFCVEISERSTPNEPQTSQEGKEEDAVLAKNGKFETEDTGLFNQFTRGLVHMNTN